MNNRGYILIVVLVAIIVLLVLSFYPVNIDNEKQENTYTVHPCKTLTIGCKAKLENTEIEIKFPGNIIFLKRFPIEVSVPALEKHGVDKVVVDFQMVGMNMGLNIYQLKQSDKDKSLWTGTGVLPVCTTGRSDWQAIVSFKEGDEVKKIAFQFEVEPVTQ